ncbi:hypothetical protein AE921_00440 [Xanthomonas arboricola]|nr:hypothetical protein AE921_00440 [Xanthomonas arboricola]KOB07251.1 hypothetical protein AE922_13745 [Xanthomonas arboricola]KOB12401.1 hypothetical protein AE923_00240 [Xanthomonas arboricola]KOB19958.1 hypothetical protein AE925_05265 [Xanthomonas arboricola]KOB24190.1 hypothetical protein AE926_07850 [Xanthomonas arboricola]
MFIARIVDVFYDGKHLRSRKDMKEICTRTLNALLESESPALRGAVGNELLNGYLDFKLGYIYREFSANIEIRSVDVERGIVEMVETTVATIIPNPGVSQIDLTWSWFSSLVDSAARAELLSVTIDGKHIELQALREKSPDTDNKFIYTHKLGAAFDDSASGPVVYTKRVKKSIDVRKDPITIYKFTAPCLGMTVTLLDLPQADLECQAQAFGLPDEFEPDRKKSEGQGHWRTQKYSRLIFPRQGVILQWNILKQGDPQ